MNVVESLNGSVYSQGIQITHEAWLDIGSEGWKDSTEKQKAAAYQAAKVCGWTDQGLKQIIDKEFGIRIDNFMANVIIETLQEYARKYPIEIETVREVAKEETVFKVNDSLYRL